jgi:hypothetical protein
MRIALRTGAGRGAYELAGRQGNLSASDLFNHEISYELTPGIVIPGRSVAALRQGKPRIALDEATRSRTTHLYLLLSAVLLLPKPKREFKTTHGDELLRSESYSMTAIKIDVARLSETSVILRPTDLLLENADGLRDEMDFTNRMARIIRLWDAAKQIDSPLANLIRNWSEAIRATDPDYKTIEKCAQEISDLLQTQEDPLPLVETQLEIVRPGGEESSGWTTTFRLTRRLFVGSRCGASRRNAGPPGENSAGTFPPPTTFGASLPASGSPGLRSPNRRASTPHIFSLGLHTI